MHQRMLKAVVIGVERVCCNCRERICPGIQNKVSRIGDIYCWSLFWDLVHNMTCIWRSFPGVRRMYRTRVSGERNGSMGTMEKKSGNFRVLTGTTSSGVVHCFAPVRLSIRMLFQDISVDCKSRTTATERRERRSWTTKVA